jgi:hypothetical protein
MGCDSRPRRLGTVGHAWREWIEGIGFPMRSYPLYFSFIDFSAPGVFEVSLLPKLFECAGNAFLVLVLLARQWCPIRF